MSDAPIPDVSESAAGAAALPYRLEVWDRPGGRAERILAVMSTSSIAYAGYYAAVREHFGETVKLTCEGRILLSSGRKT